MNRKADYTRHQHKRSRSRCHPSIVPCPVRGNDHPCFVRQIVRKRELPIEEIVAESPVYAEIATADAENERLLSCIGELDENEKELIIRRYYYEQKPAEIAVVLDIPKKQVETTNASICSSRLIIAEIIFLSFSINTSFFNSTFN